MKDGGYNNITDTNKVSPTQNTLQANVMQNQPLTMYFFANAFKRSFGPT